MIIRIFSVFLFSAFISQAGAFWEFDFAAVRGTVTYDSSSLGAFTVTTSPGYWAFQGVETYTGIQSGDTYPRSIFDPNAPADPTPVTWPVGDPATDGFDAHLFLPYIADPANPTVPAFGYYTYVPGTLSFKATATGSSVKYSGSYQILDPLGATGTYAFSGVATETSSSLSAVLRDGAAIIVFKATGPLTLTPEPATAWSGVMLAALAAWKWRRSPRRA